MMSKTKSCNHNRCIIDVIIDVSSPTTKIELFVTKINGFQPLTFVTKSPHLRFYGSPSYDFEYLTSRITLVCQF